jgi:hypothetical protein
MRSPYYLRRARLVLGSTVSDNPIFRCFRVVGKSEFRWLAFELSADLGKIPLKSPIPEENLAPSRKPCSPG